MKELRSTSTPTEDKRWRLGITVPGQEPERRNRNVESVIAAVATIFGQSVLSTMTLPIFDFLSSRTGNVLVSIKVQDDGTTALDALFIVDWELAKFGPAASDIGQFAAESWLLARFSANPSAGSSLLLSFLDGYGHLTTRENAEVAVHLASHVAVWGSRVPWSEDEAEIRRAVLENLGHVVKAWGVLQGSAEEFHTYIAP